MNYWGVVVIAVAAGLFSAVQGQLMSILDKGIGTQEGVFITYGSGGLVIGVTMLLMRGGNLSAWTNVPWYAFLAGVCGLAVVGGIGFSVSRIGVASAMTIFLVGQFVLALVLDHFGWLGAEIRPLNWSRICGVFVLLAGTWLIVQE